MVYDVVIIGAGVSGCAIARELSRYDVNVCVLEREEDVCSGTSKANSGIVHAGYDARKGSLMAKLNVIGNEMMGKLSEELDFPFKRDGSLVVCTHKEELGGLQELFDRGIANGVKGMRILSRDEALSMEPNLSDETEGALFAPTAGIVCPFNLNIALAENAFVNGVLFRFNTEVKNIFAKEDGFWHLHTSNGEYIAKYVVNAGGVYADKFHNMVSEDKIHITPRRGQYFLLDRNVTGFVSRTIFPQPTKYGKGVLVSPTVHGNIIIGPNAEDIDDKDGVNTTAEGMEELLKKGTLNVKGMNVARDVITSFAGLRAHEDGHEFIIKELEDAPHFIDAAGIESPGLTSCPAIGKMVGDMLKEKMNLQDKERWIATRKGIINPFKLDLKERNELIKKEPAYGNMICRCESVTEGQIIDAIRHPLGARSLDGIKRRTRTGMGRCQAGFCSPKVMDILSRELDLPLEKITKKGGNSSIVTGETKGEVE